MGNFLQRILTIFAISVLVVIFFFPTSHPAYTEEVASNTVNTDIVEAVSTFEPVNQLSQEVNIPTQITSVEQISDVLPSDPYFKALKTLIDHYQMDITLPDGSFQGNQPITRGDFIIYLRDSLKVINSFQERASISNVTSEQVERAVASITDIKDQADAISQKVEQIQTRIERLEKQVKKLKQPVLVKETLDASLTDNQADSGDKELEKINSATGDVSTTPVSQPLPEIDVITEVQLIEEIPDVSLDKPDEDALPQIENLDELNLSTEAPSTTPVSQPLPEIDVITEVQLIEEIPDVSLDKPDEDALPQIEKLDELNLSTENVSTTPVSQPLPEIDVITEVQPIEQIPDVSTEVNPIEQISDISSDDSYYDALTEIVENYQLDVTLPDGTFKGNQPITRGEVIIYLNDSIAKLEELIAPEEVEAQNSELELSFDNLLSQIAQENLDFAQKLAQIEQIEAQLDELETLIE